VLQTVQGVVAVDGGAAVFRRLQGRQVALRVVAEGGDLVRVGADLLAQPAELIEHLALGLGELTIAVEQFFAVTIAQSVVAVLRAVAPRIANLRQPTLVVSKYFSG
jgi:hypothetical protein